MRVDRPNWWVIGIFTGIGAGFLWAAYYVSSYWQGIFINGGTALCLFALLAFSESRLIRHLRGPHSLDEALARFAPLVAPVQLRRAASSTQTGDHNAQITDYVLRIVSRTGLHQEPPDPCSAQFKNLAGPMQVDWRIEWNDKGIWHVVKANERNIPASLSQRIDWDQRVTVHEKRIYLILCHLLREFDPAIQSMN
jgi:hypothetical protein